MSKTLAETAAYLREHRIICLSKGAIEQADELEAHAIAVEAAIAENAQVKAERDAALRDKKAVREGIAEAIIKLQDTACF
jgi:hypothetical protein